MHGLGEVGTGRGNRPGGVMSRKRRVRWRFWQVPGCGGLTFSAWTSAEKIKERWEYLHSPMHAAGYALDPEFMMNTKEWDEAVTEGTLKIIERMCDGCGCEIQRGR